MPSGISYLRQSVPTLNARHFRRATYFIVQPASVHSRALPLPLTSSVDLLGGWLTRIPAERATWGGREMRNLRDDPEVRLRPPPCANTGDEEAT